MGSINPEDEFMVNVRTITKVAVLAAAFGAAAAAVANATTWAPEDVECPLCGTMNEFQSVMSYGTYIYNWPSKFELIFWPDTESEVLYSCRNCKYTCFMYDFDDPPPDKMDALREAAAEADLGAEVDYYTDIPMTARLAAARKIYRVLERGDDFWCRFYRVVGYHAAAEGLAEEAAAARGEALAVAETLMEDEARAGERKEFLFITGAMRYLRGDEAAARADFEAALALSYDNPELEAENNEGYDGYLTALLEEYIERMDKGE
jgi:predicted  nucleic acid-binding Zn-ribbon protein